MQRRNVHKPWILGDKMPTLETIDIEYKEFCLKVPFGGNKYQGNEEEAKYLVETSYIPRSLFDLFEKNLHIYLQNYLPRYMVMFGNTEGIDYGTLYMGVSDDGEITGIPFEKSSMGYPKIYGWLETILPKHLRMGTHQMIEGDIYQTYMSYCQIKIHPLQIDPQMLRESNDDLQQKIQKIEETRMEFEKQRMDYQRKKRQWVEHVEQYKRKISILLNDSHIKNEIIDWLENLQKDSQLVHFSSKNYQEIFYQHYQMCENDPRSGRILLKPPVDVIQYLKSHIHFSLTSEYIIEEKCNVNNFVYWVLAFRDNKIGQIMKNRPIQSPFIKSTLHYSGFINQLSPMRFNWSIHNRNLKYYMIEIQIPGRQLLKEIFGSNVAMYYIPQTQNKMAKELEVFWREVDERGQPTCKHIGDL